MKRLVDTPPVYTLLVGMEASVAVNTPPVVMVCVQLLVLPSASVAVQVRVMVFPLSTSVYVTVAVPQLSVAVAVPVAAGSVEPPQYTAWLAGQLTITGAVLSSTVTVKLFDTLPQLLVAVTVTVVTPLLKLTPEPEPVPLPVVAPLRA
jgi:hypothetical protein